MIDANVPHAVFPKGAARKLATPQTRTALLGDDLATLVARGMRPAPLVLPGS
jgi:hypothetical protein